MNRPAARVLRPYEVQQRLGLSRSQLFRMERSGEFPARFYLSKQTSGWLEEDVDAWLRDRAATRTKRLAITE
jgi:predicted DNA-binding transcriptional regulator AlpA